ncbi:recombinase family protein [Streptomyces sp. NPDC001156]
MQEQPFGAGKVTADHLRRGAYLYVRQSSLKQVVNNTESTARQYALRGRAIALGWGEGQITVIDTDQGQSGATAAGRDGFKLLVSEVSLGRAGIVLGLEVSRLARNNTDWHRLLGAPRSITDSCGDGRAPPPGRRSGRVKLEAA